MSEGQDGFFFLVNANCAPEYRTIVLDGSLNLIQPSKDGC